MLTTKRKPASVGEILVEEFMEPLRLVVLEVTGYEYSRHAVLLVRRSGHIFVLDNIAKEVQADRWFENGAKFVGQMVSAGGRVATYDVNPQPYYR